MNNAGLFVAGVIVVALYVAIGVFGVHMHREREAHIAACAQKHAIAIITLGGEYACVEAQ